MNRRTVFNDIAALMAATRVSNAQAPRRGPVFQHDQKYLERELMSFEKATIAEATRGVKIGQ
jgi:hypothetical protein